MGDFMEINEHRVAKNLSFDHFANLHKQNLSKPLLQHLIQQNSTFIHMDFFGNKIEIFCCNGDKHKRVLTWFSYHCFCPPFC